MRWLWLILVFVPMLLMAMVPGQGGGGGDRWGKTPEATRTRAPTWTPGATATLALATATLVPATALPTSTPAPVVTATFTPAPTLSPIPAFTATPFPLPTATPATNEDIYYGIKLRYTNPDWLQFPRSALDDLWANSPTGFQWLAYVQRNIAVIEQHGQYDCLGYGGFYGSFLTLVSGQGATIYDCAGGPGGVQPYGGLYASILVHEATHQAAFLLGQQYVGCSGELKGWTAGYLYGQVAGVPSQGMGPPGC